MVAVAKRLRHAVVARIHEGSSPSGHPKVSSLAGRGKLRPVGEYGSGLLAATDGSKPTTRGFDTFLARHILSWLLWWRSSQLNRLPRCDPGITPV